MTYLLLAGNILYERNLVVVSQNKIFYKKNTIGHERLTIILEQPRNERSQGDDVDGCSRRETSGAEGK